MWSSLNKSEVLHKTMVRIMQLSIYILWVICFFSLLRVKYGKFVLCLTCGWSPSVHGIIYAFWPKWSQWKCKFTSMPTEWNSKFIECNKIPHFKTYKFIKADIPILWYIWNKEIRKVLGSIFLNIFFTLISEAVDPVKISSKSALSQV